MPAPFSAKFAVPPELMAGASFTLVTVIATALLAVTTPSEAMTLNTAKRDDTVWAEVRRLFSDAEIVEISYACGMFNMINRLNDSFRTELEPEEYNRRQHGAVKVTRATLDDYACTFCQGDEK